MIDQIGIMVLGVTAVWLSQATEWKVQRWACLFGMCSQPFWIYAAFTANQWGILFCSALYTVSWGRGIYNNWLRYNPRWMRWRGRTV